MIKKEKLFNGNILPILALFIANGVSMTGNMLSTIAIPWFVLQTTGSATQMGLVGFFTITPIVLAGLLGGVLVDTVGFKKTSIIADLSSGFTVIFIPLFYLTVGLPFWLLLILVFLGALLDAPGSIARSAMLPELAEKAGMSFERASSINQVVERSSRLLGAPLAGILIMLMGSANVLWFDGLSFFFSAALIGIFVKLSTSGETKYINKSYFEELMVGFKFVFQNQLLFTIVIIVMITNFLDSAFSSVIRPVYVNKNFGSSLALGLIIAANGGGAMFGAFLFGWIGHWFPRRAIFISMFIFTSFRFVFYVFYPPLWVILLSTFIFSVSAGPLNPIIDAIEFECIPVNLRGRVLGSITAGMWVAMPLSILVAGVLVDQFGIFPMILGIGFIYFVTTVSLVFLPSLRLMGGKNEIK